MIKKNKIESFNDKESLNLKTNINHINQIFFPNKEITAIHAKRSNSLNSTRSNRNGSQIYNSLTSSNNVKRVLINLGGINDNIVKNKKKMEDTSVAAVKIQSVIRMYLVKRGIRKNVLDYQDKRHTLIVECLAKKGNWSKFYTPLVYYDTKKINDTLIDLLKLTEKYNDRQVLIFIFQSSLDDKILILKFLFLCSLRGDSDYINPMDLKIIMIDILCLNLNDAYFLSYGSIFNREPYNGQIDFTQFYNWFLQIPRNERPKMSKFYYVYKYLYQRLRKLFGFNLPLNFIKNFIENRSALYDLAFELYNFDRSNNVLFRCPVCKRLSPNSLKLFKHIPHCRKRQEEKLEREKPDENKSNKKMEKKGKNK